MSPAEASVFKVCSHCYDQNYKPILHPRTLAELPGTLEIKILKMRKARMSLRGIAQALGLKHHTIVDKHLKRLDIA